VEVPDVANESCDPVAALRSLAVETEPTTAVQRAWPWVQRAAWAALAVSWIPLLSAAGSERSRPVALVIVVIAWLFWAAGFLSTLIPHPVGLVAVRCAGLFAAATSVWSATVLLRRNNDRLVLCLAGVVVAVAAFAVALHAETGDLAVNGPAYPNERRFLLRPSALLQVVVLPLSACVLLVGVVTGPLLLAARQWVIGALLTLVGGAVAAVLARSLYGIAKRFVVFVPAGFVLHDVTVLREPALFRRQSIEAIGPAPSDTDALDLTSGAAGLANEIRFHEKVELTLRQGRTQFREGRSGRFLFVPTLPGRMLTEARERRYSTVVEPLSTPIES
jgi:hypothetical protein